MLQDAQEAAGNKVHSELEAQITKLSNLQKAMSTRSQVLQLQNVREAQGISSHSISLQSNDAPQSTANEVCALNNTQLRLLVEDQHWSVIQLLRALNQQLEEIKRSTRSQPVILNDGCIVHSRVPERNIGAHVRKTAVMLLATMTIGVTTGVIVGKASTMPGASHINSSLLTSQPSDYATMLDGADVYITPQQNKEPVSKPPESAPVQGGKNNRHIAEHLEPDGPSDRGARHHSDVMYSESRGRNARVFDMDAVNEFSA